MSRGLRMSEEQLAERQKRLYGQKPLTVTPEQKSALFGQVNKDFDEHMAGDKPKRIAPVDRTVNAPKYRNQRVEVDGIKFDSKKEAKRWQELKLLYISGEISQLERQVRYTLLPSQQRDTGKKERSVEYVADFVYWRDVGALAPIEVVEDVKGMKTPLYILKRKLMLWVHGITIKEI